MEGIKGKVPGVPPDRGDIIRAIKDIGPEHRRAIEEAITNTAPKPKSKMKERGV